MLELVRLPDRDAEPLSAHRLYDRKHDPWRSSSRDKRQIIGETTMPLGTELSQL